jgi:ribulose-5-phosphate 4-epimerase/fuculose-1-phosphate aldolase
VFAAVAEERLHRKRMLAAAFRLFSRFGFDEEVAGHIPHAIRNRLSPAWRSPSTYFIDTMKPTTLI